MTDEDYMREALHEAQAASLRGEVPVGAVIVNGQGQIIARAGNAPIAINDPTAHAEILAMRDAAYMSKNYRLGGLTLYVTLEPCTMCAGAAVNARVERVVFGAADLEAGALGSVYNVGVDPRLRHTFEVEHDVLGEACAQALKSFFSSLRSSSR